jgi:hypothetical protein
MDNEVSEKVSEHSGAELNGLSESGIKSRGSLIGQRENEF